MLFWVGGGRGVRREAAKFLGRVFFLPFLKVKKTLGHARTAALCSLTRRARVLDHLQAIIARSAT